MTTPDTSSTLRSPWRTNTMVSGASSSSDRYFSKSSQEQWLFRPGAGTPTMFRNRQYPSASAALDAYISEYENRPHSLHQNSGDDVLQLLLAGKNSGSRSSGVWNQSNVQALADINQMVDNSYQKLELASSALDDSSRAMRAVDHDPLPSPSDLAVPARRFDSQSTITTDQLLMANPLGLTNGPLPLQSKEHGHSAQAHRDIPGYLSTSHLQSTHCRFMDSVHVHGPSAAKNGVSLEERFSSRSLDSLLDLETQPHSALYKENFVSFASSGPSSIQPSNTMETRQGSSNARQVVDLPSWVNDLEDSDTSSIVTGHGLTLTKRRFPGSKMASTPKQSRSQARQLNNRQRSLDSGPGLDIRDLQNTLTPDRAKSNLRNSYYSHPSAKTNLSNQHPYSTKPCLKQSGMNPLSPKGLGFTAAKVSFADDTQLSSRYYSRASMPLRTRSRSQSVGESVDIDKRSSLSSLTDNLVSYPASGSKPTAVLSRSLDRTASTNPNKSSSFSRKGFKPRDSREAVVSGGFQEIQNPDHRHFLQRLMKEIEKSSSSIVSEMSPPDFLTSKPNGSHLRGGQGLVPVKRQLFDGRLPDNSSEGALSQTVEWGSDATSMGKEQGAGYHGYLARIKQLLSPPDSYTGIQQAEPPTSPATDTLLDGDRPWEQHPTIKPPVQVEGTSSSNELLRKYKQACMMSDTAVTLDNTLTVGPQPGSLEALKQMLFSMQSFADVDQATGANHLDYSADKTQNTFAAITDESQILSPSTKQLLADTQQPGGESLNRAMQHLQRLKHLVENDGQHKPTPHQ